MTFPSWRYGPGGQTAIFQREADVPKGWFDHPSKVPQPTSNYNDAVRKEFAAFDHDGDGKPGGSLPKKRGRPRKA